MRDRGSRDRGSRSASLDRVIRFRRRNATLLDRLGVVLVIVALWLLALPGNAAGIPGKRPPKNTTTTTSTTSTTSTTTTSTTTTSTTTTPPGGGGQVYTAPTSIAADCSRTVEVEIMDWIASVPDSSTLEFPAGACYALDKTITVSDRVGLTINGNGATFKAVTPGTSNRDNWRFYAGSNLNIKNIVVRGAHPHAGIFDDSYVRDNEWQHGIRLAGVHGATLDNIAVYDVYGDFVEAMWDSREPDRMKWVESRNVTVKNSRFERNGRMGFGLTHVNGFVLENSYVANVNWSIVNSELDFEIAMSRNIRIANNTFGPVRHTVYVNAGGTANVSDVILDNNTMVGPLVTCWPPVYVETPLGLYRERFTITNNRLIAYGDAVQLYGVRTANVSGNTVNFVNGGCDTLAGVRVTDSHDVSVTNNAFNGAEQAVKQDAASTNITQSGNTL